MLGFIRVGFCFSTQTPDWFRRESWEMRPERYLGVTLKKILNASQSICDFILWVLYQRYALESLDVLVEIW